MSTQPLWKQIPTIGPIQGWMSFVGSLNRLARLQFRPGTFYTRLLTYIPIAALGLSWVLWMRHSDNGNTLLDDTISLRHLVLAGLMFVVWNFVCFVSKQGDGANNTFQAEIISKVLASLLCVALVGIGHAMFSPNNAAPFALNLMECLFGLYGLLLLFAWLVSEHLLPWMTHPTVTLIVGTGTVSRKLRATLQTANRQYKVIGCIDDKYMGKDAGADKYLGNLSELEVLLKTKPIESVLIGLPIKSMYESIQRVIETCEAVGVDAYYMANMFETTLAQTQLVSSPHQAHVTILGTPRSDYRSHVKRALDIIGSFVLLLLATPLLVATAIAIRITSPGPIFFSQERYGMHRQRFHMFKFRTMVVDAEARQAALEAANEAQGPVFKIKKDPRITPIGSFLRRTSIDELPQLFNVLLGDMSLVGPRPLPLRDVGRFEEAWLLRRFSVKPGLTCLWQVNGRSNSDFSDWIRQDLQYIDGWSLMLDIHILLKTIPAVLRGSGAV